MDLGCHSIAVIGIKQGGVFQLDFLNINQIIKSARSVIILTGFEDIEIVIANRIRIQVDKCIFKDALSDYYLILFQQFLEVKHQRQVIDIG